MKEGFADSCSAPKWHNCCWRIRVPSFLIWLGLTVKLYFNPIIISLCLEFSFVVLHFSDISNKELIVEKLCHLHHFIIPPMVTLVGFYAIFKQRRPSVHLVGGKYVAFGTCYGMPSGDVLMAATLGCTAIDNGYVLVGVLLTVFVSFSRVVVGYHSIDQVIAGALFGGVSFSLSKVMSEEHFVCLNWLLALILPMLVFFDKHCECVEKNDFDNLQVWVVIDIGYLTFDMFYCAPTCISGLRSGTKLVIATLSILVSHVLSYKMCETGFSITLFTKKLLRL